MTSQTIGVMDGFAYVVFTKCASCDEYVNTGRWVEPQSYVRREMSRTSHSHHVIVKPHSCEALRDTAI